MHLLHICFVFDVFEIFSLKKTCNGFFAKIVFGFFCISCRLGFKKSKSKQLLYVLPYFFFCSHTSLRFGHFFVYGDFCASLFANVGFRIFCMFMCFCVFFRYWHMSQFLMKFDEITIFIKFHQISSKIEISKKHKKFYLHNH